MPEQPETLKPIDFYFDFRSPYSYLASTALPKLAAERGAAIAYHPFRIRELMKTVGNRPTTLESENKGRYARTDLLRWARRYRVPFQGNPNMPKIDFLLLGQLVLVANEQDRGAACVNAIFPAVWASGDDLSDKALLTRRLDEAGFAGAAMIEQASAGEYTAKLDEVTAKAAQRGVFGAPTIFVGSDMFFGNDRLDFVAEALKASEQAA
jgi:2-hydroxychromene-2-carboxylate isomerase